VTAGSVKLALLPLLLAIGAPQGETIRFITCPAYRDTDAGKKSGCWLADDHDSGRRFDVSRAPSKPDWNHEVLVEGRTAANVVSNCGGEVLDPVRTSILPGECPRHMLPAEGFAGNKFALPPRNVRPLSEVRPTPPAPWTDRTFTLLFDFDKAFMVYQLDDYLIDQAITYIRAVNPRKVVVTGWAASDPSRVSGRDIAEKPEIARTRAELVGEALSRLGVAKEKVEIRWRTGAQPSDAEGADGLAEPSRRRVDIEVRL
jgi:outer membrane protein OmpA-like peptidoglycan-associated protein